MEVSVGVILTAFVSALVVSVATLVVAVIRVRRSPEDRLIRFTYGWLGAFALFTVLVCGVGIAWVVGDYAGSSGWVIVGLVAVNMLVQPLALLFCWVGACKLTLGLCGHVWIAFHRVPEEQLIRFSTQERSELARYCAIQGVLALGMGSAISAGCLWPLVKTVLG